MTLTLRAVSLNEQPLTQPISAHFDAKGGTIGRHDDNTLALPDPERHISRRQAEIRAAASGLHHPQCRQCKPDRHPRPAAGAGRERRARASRSGAHRRLSAGSDRRRRRCRGFDDHPRPRQRGSQCADAARSSPPTPRGAAAPADLGGPFADLALPASDNDPFADLLGPGAAPGPAAPWRPEATPAPRRLQPPAAEKDAFAELLPPAAGVMASSPAWGPSAPSQETPKLPHDFDPFAPRPASPAVAHGEDGGGGAFDDLIPGARPAAIDSVAALEAGGGDALAGFLDHRCQVKQAHQSPAIWPVPCPPIRWRRLFGTPAPARAQATRRDDTPELRAAYLPPAARPRPASPDAPAAMPVQAEAPHAAARAHETELWVAFCEGAGVRWKPRRPLN